MILLTFRTPEGIKLGVKTEQGVVDVAVNPTIFYRAGEAMLPTIEKAVAQAVEDGNFLAEESLQYGPAVPEPGKILCVGLNYQRHAAESGMEPPKTPVLFSKFNNAIAAPGEDIPLADQLQQVDYEAELVVIIGKQAKNVSVDDALDYVLGYCNSNDLSERHLQMLTGQWLLGKTLDKFLPVGPYVVTADEVDDPQNLSIRCWLNGELRQDSSTADMIFSVAEIVSYASQYMTLKPGDIISTGTPEGVILGMSEKVWMKPGDETVIEVAGLGRLVNKMVTEG